MRDRKKDNSGWIVIVTLVVFVILFFIFVF